jgi:hypothetical protein
MKFKQLLLSVAFILAPLTSVFAGDDPVRIEVKVPQLSGQEIFLCHYFNGLVYKQDSIRLSSYGEGVFQKGEKYRDGWPPWVISFPAK